MDDKTEITLKLTLGEIKKILAGLAERPYKQVVELILKIKSQIKG